MSDGHSHHHIVPFKYYIGTFVALLFLTFITVWIAQFDFGAFNFAVAMAIAVTKAALVVMFFMALRWDKGFNVVLFLGAILFFTIFVGITLSDYVTRANPDPIEAGYHDLKSPVKVVEPGEAGHGSHGKKSGHGGSDGH